MRVGRTAEISVELIALVSPEIMPAKVFPAPSGILSATPKRCLSWLAMMRVTAPVM